MLTKKFLNQLVIKHQPWTVVRPCVLKRGLDYGGIPSQGTSAAHLRQKNPRTSPNSVTASIKLCPRLQLAQFSNQSYFWTENLDDSSSGQYWTKRSMTFDGEGGGYKLCPYSMQQPSFYWPFCPPQWSILFCASFFIGPQTRDLSYSMILEFITSICFVSGCVRRPTWLHGQVIRPDPPHSRPTIQPS